MHNLFHLLPMTRTSFVAIVIICVFLFFSRLYNLGWGAPFYFHPDERNIAFSITQLRFPSQMNPHFFAYGSFPLYVIYFTSIIYSFILCILQVQNTCHALLSPSFESIILSSRFLSAVLGILLIPSIFLIGKKIKDTTTGFIASTLAVFSTGLIQYAHFGTFEMWLTFLALWLFYFCLSFMKSNNIRDYIISSIIFGLLLATKISILSLFIGPLFIFINSNTKGINFSLYLISSIKRLFGFCLIVSVVFIVTSPFVILDFLSFYASIHYESRVALGTLPVFYTGSFYNTLPVIFQFLYIYPFITNPFSTVFFICALPFFLITIIKKPSRPYLLLIIFYCLLFFPQAFLFTKWTRYIIPTLPFLYLLLGIVLSEIKKTWIKTFYITLVIISFFYSSLFLYTVYIKSDTRQLARLWATQHIPASNHILTEVYDLGILPFNNFFSNITLFNFYNLDDRGSKEQYVLSNILMTTDTIVLPSQRIIRNRLLQEESFPKGNFFYNNLLHNKNSFEKIYETPCDIFCKILYNGNPIFSVEETATVFDRPTVFIFQKK